MSKNRFRELSESMRDKPRHRNVFNQSSNRSWLGEVDDSGYVYLMRSSDDLCKIGQSIHPKKRRRQISYQNAVKGLEIVCTVWVDDVYTFEKLFQEPFKGKRVKGKTDWFHLSITDIFNVWNQMQELAVERGWEFNPYIDVETIQKRLQLSTYESEIITALRSGNYPEVLQLISKHMGG